MGIEEINIEADGFVTKDTDCSWGKPLEQVTDNTANPIWRLTADLIADMERRLTELEELVTDEILRANKVRRFHSIDEEKLP